MTATTNKTMIDANDETILFLYGTLRPHLAPPAIAAVARRLRWIGDATIAGTLYNVGRYPAAVLGGAGRVRGGVYACPADDDTLARFDAYEGVNSGLYRRVRVDVAFDSPPARPHPSAWVYEYARSVDALPLVPGGDWATNVAASNSRGPEQR